MNSLQVVDCTLRDGGHYTNWFFETEIVQSYLDAISLSGITNCELGYRRPYPTNCGEWASSSDKLINSFDLPPHVKLGVMVDLKDFLDRPDQIQDTFQTSEKSPLSFVRIAAHYHDYQSIAQVATPLSELGYTVSLNLMRSGNTEISKIENVIKYIADNFADKIKVLTFADSFGSMNQAYVESLISIAQKYWKGPIGFHGHDNRQEALTNSLKAIDLGCDYIDSTITGMGKGAGNTATEFLLIELIKRGEHFAHEPLHQMIRDYFIPLKNKLGWGSDLFTYLAAEKGIHPDNISQLKNTKELKNGICSY